MLRIGLTATAAAVVFCVGVGGLAAGQSEMQRTLLLKELHARGPSARVAIYPVYVLGKPSGQVADALGLVLEKHGMDRLESVERAFARPADSPWESIADAFSRHVKQQPPDADYALYAEFLGEPRSGPTEVRWLLVKPDGTIVVADRQKPGDGDFKRTAGKDPDPLGCATLVGARLFSLADWRRPFGARPDGKFVKAFRAKSGIPDDAEFSAMKRRLATFKAAKDARIQVYPTRVAGKPDATGGARLAEALRVKLGRPAYAGTAATTFSLEPASNQQKVLWQLAAEFRKHVRANPPDADYALLADYWVVEGMPARAVHFVVCDRTGEWVVVDFQNDQHSDYKAIAPKTVAGCEALTVARLRRQLK